MAQVATDADTYASTRLNIFFPGVIPSLDGQCVSLVKYFMAEMSEVPNPQAPRGDAKLVGRTLVAQGHAVEIPYAQRKEGDIICYEYGVYGHIAVQLSAGRLFEQNINMGGVASKIVDGARVYASRIGNEGEAWRVGKNPHVYRLKSYSEGGSMTEELARALAKWGRLLGFNSEEKMYAASKDDVKQIMANPMYAAALLEQLYKGEWQEPAWKANNYDAYGKTQYQKGLKDGAGSGSSLPPGTYVKVDKVNVIEVK